MPEHSSKRRSFLKATAGLGASLALPAGLLADTGIHRRSIPGSGERLPVIGMGTWITFDVGNAVTALAMRQQVLLRFFKMGGSLVDSSPMYGTAQQVLGHCLDRLERPDGLFAATKVWIPGRLAGINQAQRSARLWGVDKFDLLMVHNMVDWETHLETLQQWKADGRLRYHGITTSHGRRQQQMESVVCKQPFDFIQFTYNIVDREAERLLLPLAQEHGKAVILNRPFRGGSLFRYVRNKSLPGWAAEIDVQNWAQYFLKFAVSHPAVTCAIPATSRVDHMVENMGALQGPLPDEALRREMVAYFERIRA